MHVADIGCGSFPFPPATLLVDRYPTESGHRQEDLDTAGKPLVVADVEALPFTDKSIDFVYCSHVLEHVADPIQAVRELNRVGKAGLVCLPSIMDEAYARAATPDSQIGHHWLCWRHREGGLFLLKCDTRDRPRTLQVLTDLGVWPVVLTAGYGTEVRMGWGWGGWPDVLNITVVGLKGDTESG